MILLETSALIEACRRNGREDVRARVESALRSGKAALCQPVLLELRAGLKHKSEFDQIDGYAELLPLLPVTDPVWNLAGERTRLFRSVGITVSNSDILIFATAEHHNANIVTIDAHFALMRDALRKATGK